MGFIIYINGDMIACKSIIAKTALNSTAAAELLITFHLYRALASTAKILTSSTFALDGHIRINTDSKPVQEGLTNGKYDPTMTKYIHTN